jgi:hypothetical protein
MSRRKLIAVADLSGQRSACPVQDGQISAFSCHPRIARQPRSLKPSKLATSRRSGVEDHRITASHLGPPSMVSEKGGAGGRGQAALVWMRHRPRPGDGPPSRCILGQRSVEHGVEVRGFGDSYFVGFHSRAIRGDISDRAATTSRAGSRRRRGPTVGKWSSQARSGARPLPDDGLRTLPTIPKTSPRASVQFTPGEREPHWCSAVKSLRWGPMPGNMPLPRSRAVPKTASSL